MTAKNYLGYSNINLDDCMETMGISNDCIRDRMYFSLALSDLLRYYDELSAAMHEGFFIQESLVHLYSRLFIISGELTVNGIDTAFNSILKDEISLIFATISTLSINEPSGLSIWKQ